MGRPRLTDEERLARKKARSAHSFSDAAYTHFDPRKVGYGSADEWAAAADALSGGRGTLKQERRSIHDMDLETLGLEALPITHGDLKKAFRVVLFRVHPDHGGSNEETIRAMSAFERLSKLY